MVMGDGQAVKDRGRFRYKLNSKNSISIERKRGRYKDEANIEFDLIQGPHKIADRASITGRVMGYRRFQYLLRFNRDPFLIYDRGIYLYYGWTIFKSPSSKQSREAANPFPEPPKKKASKPNEKKGRRLTNP
jgi:hypothetical protein